MSMSTGDKMLADKLGMSIYDEHAWADASFSVLANMIWGTFWNLSYYNIEMS